MPVSTHDRWIWPTHRVHVARWFEPPGPSPDTDPKDAAVPDDATVYPDDTAQASDDAPDTG